jgi:hypothetical protein
MQLFSNDIIKIMVVVILISGCAYKEYDADNEAVYKKYWCDPTSRKASVTQLVPSKYKSEGQEINYDDCSSVPIKDETDLNRKALLQPILTN